MPETKMLGAFRGLTTNRNLPQTYTANPDTTGACLHVQNEHNPAKKHRKFVHHQSTNRQCECDSILSATRYL